MATLLERIEARRRAEACSRDDDPSEHDKPRKVIEPEWRRYVREHRQVRVDWGRPA